MTMTMGKMGARLHHQHQRWCGGGGGASSSSYPNKMMMMRSNSRQRVGASSATTTDGAGNSDSTDDRTSDAMDNLWRWLESRGADVSGTEPYRTNAYKEIGSTMDAGWGVRARKPIGKNERAMMVPKTCWLTPDVGYADAELSRALKSLPDLAPWTVLALTLLKERQRGSASDFAPYVQALPKSLDSPLFWSAEELSELAGTQLLDNAASYDSYLRSVYEDLCTGLFQTYPDVFPLDGESFFDEASFRWAFGILRSRALPPCEGANIALVPGIDMINHSTLSGAKWSANGGIAGAVAGLFGGGKDGGGSMRVDATDGALKAGEPLLVNYAPNGTDSQFALDFGFVDAVTPSPGYSLTLSIPEDDPNVYDKLDVLDVAGLSETPSFVLRPYSDPDPELRTFLRLLNCQGQDAFLLEALFRQQCWQLISDPLSKENEADCCASILDGVAAALSAYASRGVDQEKSALTSTPGSLTHRQNLAVRVRLAEKSALIETASFFDVVASRLDKLEYYQERRLRSLNLLDEDGSSTYDPFKETMA
jgi:[ribulose-bisphosphate carboxylase]-lysine N-methyltransferase